MEQISEVWKSRSVKPNTHPYRDHRINCVIYQASVNFIHNVIQAYRKKKEKKLVRQNCNWLVQKIQFRKKKNYKKEKKIQGIDHNDLA